MHGWLVRLTGIAGGRSSLSYLAGLAGGAGSGWDRWLGIARLAVLSGGRVGNRVG